LSDKIISVTYASFWIYIYIYNVKDLIIF